MGMLTRAGVSTASTGISSQVVLAFYQLLLGDRKGLGWSTGVCDNSCSLIRRKTGDLNFFSFPTML